MLRKISARSSALAKCSKMSLSTDDSSDKDSTSKCLQKCLHEICQTRSAGVIKSGEDCQVPQIESDSVINLLLLVITLEMISYHFERYITDIRLFVCKIE